MACGFVEAGARQWRSTWRRLTHALGFTGAGDVGVGGLTGGWGVTGGCGVTGGSGVKGGSGVPGASGALTVHVTVAAAPAVPALLSWRVLNVCEPTLRPFSATGEVQAW